MEPRETTSLFDKNTVVISAYTRAQAISDGVLVDLTEWASERQMRPGFRCSVCVTQAVWGAIESIPDSLKGIADVRGRAHDVLWMGYVALRRGMAGDKQHVAYQLTLPCKGTRQRLVTLYIDCSGGDNGEPVVTIGFRDDF